VRLGESENVENADKAELRLQLLKTAEDLLRGSLRRVQTAEEVSHLQTELAALKLKEIDRDEERQTAVSEQLAQCFERAAITTEAQNGLYANTEEEMCLADQRSQRLSLILRSRATLSRVYQSQGLVLESFYVLRQGLINFKALAEGQYREVEKGSESESKGSFKLPEALSGGGAPPAKKGAPPAKDAKGGKGAPADDPEAKRLEEERAKQASEEAGGLRAEIEARERRTHPHMGLWLSAKVAIIGALLSEKRYEDCADAIAVTRLEAQSVRDQLYTRKLKEMEFLMFVQSGDLREASIMAKDIRKHGSKYHQSDDSYCEFLGNLSELLYNQSKNTEACAVIKEARELVWARLKAFGVAVDPQNINGSSDVKVWEDRKQATEEELETALANVASAGAAGGKGKAPEKGGKAAPAKGAAAEEAEETTETSSLDFSKPLDYKLTLADSLANSSSRPQNIYIQGLETAIRFDLRHA